MTAALQGKVFADKGHLSQSLLIRLWQCSLQWVTSIRRNRKSYPMPLLDKLFLRKRFIIETLFDKFKSNMGLEHVQPRSPINALVHVLSYLVAYSLAHQKVNRAISLSPTLWRAS